MTDDDKQRVLVGTLTDNRQPGGPAHDAAAMPTVELRPARTPAGSGNTPPSVTTLEVGEVSEHDTSSSQVRSGGAVHDYPSLRPIDPKHYVLGEELARGGMGRILRARDRRLGRPVAIKELLVQNPALQVRFEREARITAKLQHPSIVNLLEAGEWPNGDPFYVMKLVTGESLDKVVALRSTLDARLGLLPNVIAVVDALAYAHDQHVIHRDLKPSNVLVGEFGETVVIDWGLAKDLTSTTSDDVSASPQRSDRDEVGATVAGSVIGTPAYMPAEQALGDVVDERADVYALGAMLYYVLVGAPPYVGKTTVAILKQVVAGSRPPIEARVEGVPPELITIVNKAMAHVAADRYPTAKGLADDLKKFQTGQLVGAHQYTTWELVRRWIRRHRTAVLVASVATVVLILVGVFSVRTILDKQAAAEEQARRAQQAKETAEAERTRATAEATRARGAERQAQESLDQLKKQIAATEAAELAAKVSNAEAVHSKQQLEVTLTQAEKDKLRAEIEAKRASEAAARAEAAAAAELRAREEAKKLDDEKKARIDVENQNRKQIQTKLK